MSNLVQISSLMDKAPTLSISQSKAQRAEDRQKTEIKIGADQAITPFRARLSTKLRCGQMVHPEMHCRQ